MGGGGGGDERKTKEERGERGSVFERVFERVGATVRKRNRVVGEIETESEQQGRKRERGGNERDRRQKRGRRGVG